MSANYKGAGVVFLRKFIQAHGVSIEKDFRQKLGPQLAEFYVNTQTGDWVSIDMAAQLYALAADLLYPGDALGLRHLGRERAQYHFGGIYKFFLRVATVSFIVQRAAKLWSTSYKQGVAQVQQSGDKKEAFFIVEGFPELPETMREVGCGYIQGLLAFTKISNIHVDRDNANPNAWKWKVTWD